MNTNSIYALMDLMVAGCGAYVIYLAVTLKMSGKIQKNVLLPKDLEPKKCKDPEGYIKYMVPRQLAFGVVAMICGAIGLIQDYTMLVGMVPYLIAIVVFLASVVWYSVGMKKAVKQYW